MQNLKIVFMGTPEFSVPVLLGLIKNYQVVGVVTQPDKIVGRKKELTSSPIKKVALENNIKVFQPVKIREDYQNIIALKPDLIVTCAYGQIVPKEILNCPKYSCINVHASLLPKLRGGAPIHHALIDGYDETGITIMYMNEAMDEGDILTQREIPITKDLNLEKLHDKLSIMGRDLLLETIPLLINNKIKPIKQNNSEATYGYNIKRIDEHLDFTKSCKEIFNQIRGLSPNPGAFAILNSKIIKIYDSKETEFNTASRKPGQIINIYQDGIGVATSDKEIIITLIKPEGKNKITVKDYLNGMDKKKLSNQRFE